MEATARAAADLFGVQANAAALFYSKIRAVVADKLEAGASKFAGEVELDESYFGGVCKGKRSRGAARKVPVIGILKRGSLVYTPIIDNTGTDTLMPIIRSKFEPQSIICTYAYYTHIALNVSELRHVRINQSVVSANSRNNINGIKSFWDQAKRVLRKYNGISAKQFFGPWKKLNFCLIMIHMKSN